MIDVLLVVLVVGAGILGWRRGLSVSLLAALAFTITGLPAAAIAAAIGRPPPIVAFIGGGLLGLVPFALRIDAIVASLDELLANPRIRTADRCLGALLNVALAVALGWFLAAVAAIVPGDSPALSAMRSSTTFGTLVDAVPPQGTLGALVLRSGLVPGLNGPLVLAEAPEEASARTPGVLAARDRVLQVRSTACNAFVTGTGWVAGPGIVVTNAHVVAGATTSYLAGGPRFEGAPATVTAFDPVNDVAVLVLDRPGDVLPPPLRIVPRVQHGERAAVIGYPLGGEQTAIPARIDRVASFDIEPLGGGPAQSARILAFRAGVQPGNSGGPIVAEDGSVLGLVVSKALGQRIDAAYGVPSDALLDAIARGSGRQPVSTGACLESSDLEEDGVLPPRDGSPAPDPSGALPGG